MQILHFGQERSRPHAAGSPPMRRRQAATQPPHRHKKPATQGKRVTGQKDWRLDNGKPYRIYNLSHNLIFVKRKNARSRSAERSPGGTNEKREMVKGEGQRGLAPLWLFEDMSPSPDVSSPMRGGSAPYCAGPMYSRLICAKGHTSLGHRHFPPACYSLLVLPAQPTSSGSDPAPCTDSWTRTNIKGYSGALSLHAPKLCR